MASESIRSVATDRTVLLIEDDPGDARLVEETLRDVDGRRASVRGSGDDGSWLVHEPTLASGLDRLAEGDVDVLLLDLGLPESSGLDALSRVRARIDDVPIVVLTDRPAVDHGVEALARGARECLVKDEVTPEVLVRAIEFAFERERSERALRRRTEELAILNRLTRHDVRNDVSLVVGRAGELREALDPDERRLADEIISASNHVVQLTRSVEAAVESIRTGERSSRPMDLRRVLAAEVETARALYDGARFDLECDGVIEVRANECLPSVFANLLGNAVRYNDAETPEVTVSATVDRERATVRIADNGPGVPTHRRAELFGAPTDGVESGTSVGLYLVGWLVDRYGGDVVAENREEGGAVFSVTLPLASAADNAR